MLPSAGRLTKWDTHHNKQERKEKQSVLSCLFPVPIFYLSFPGTPLVQSKNGPVGKKISQMSHNELNGYNYFNEIIKEYLKSIDRSMMRLTYFNEFDGLYDLNDVNRH